MTRHEFLSLLHEQLQPRSYLEIGVNLGRSLATVNCPAVGIDPGYRITSDVRCPLRLYRMTSDDYFRANDPRDVFAGDHIDLAFIDGMHLAEFAYRDFVNAERVCGPASVVVLDDMLPRNVDEAARDRHTGAWTGDVFKVAEALRRLRPDLAVLAVNTEPTGVVVVLNLDPGSTVLADAYDSEVDFLTSPDPQRVPREILSRQASVDPTELMASDLWSRLIRLRNSGAETAQVRAATAGVLGTQTDH